MRRYRIPVLLAAVVLLGAACSSGGSSGGSTTTTAARNPSSSSTTAPPGDAALAAAGLVTQADLPGYTRNPASTKRELDAIDAKAKTLPECQTFEAAKRDGEVQRRSPKWAKNQTTVDSSTDVYADTAEIAAQLELYRDPTIIDCYRALYTAVITERLGTKGTLVSVDISPIAVEIVGDAQFGFRITVTVESNGATQTQIADAIGIQVGRVGLSLNVSGTVAEMAKVESELLPVLVKRLQDAQA